MGKREEGRGKRDSHGGTEARREEVKEGRGKGGKR
jgi:hypothetical protein